MKFAFMLVIIFFQAESAMLAQDALCFRRDGETVLCYSACGKNETLCVEEEFDLGNEEISRIEKFSGGGHVYFVLETPYSWLYVLFLKDDGKLELRRLQIP